MKVYHGSSRVFESFDITKMGGGVGVSRIAEGMYFATAPGVADYYRDRVSVPNHDYSDLIIHSEHGPLTGELVKEAISALEIYKDQPEGSIAWRKAAFELQTLGLSGSEVPVWGAVYEAEIPDRHSFLVWEGDADQQPFDVFSLVRELYDEDALEEVFDEAAEDSPLGVTHEYFEEVFNKALVQGVAQTRDELRDISPGFEWSKLDNVIGKACPYLVLDDAEEVGRGLYHALSHHLGSAKKAGEWLAQRGIKGAVTRQEFSGYDGECELFVVWALEDAKIKKMLDPKELELHAVKAQQKAPLSCHGFSDKGPAL